MKLPIAGGAIATAVILICVGGCSGSAAPSTELAPTPTDIGAAEKPVFRAELPGMIEAENFDRGGEGTGYHDNVPGNAGGQYRRGEDVDIIATADSAGGYYDINHFETGEWLAYTIDLPDTARYDIELRVATAFSDTAFHIELDGRDISGRVTIPSTSSWTSYQWVSAGSFDLIAGAQLLKIVADRQYFNLNSIRITRTPVSAPYSGQPIAVPGTFAAEDFDLGGQGVAYLDHVPGNAGGQYRVTEDVDIIATADSGGGFYDVNSFETGEWLAYTIEAGADGRYILEIRAATAFDDAALHISVDKRSATGRVAIPNTGGWTSYRWISAGEIEFAAGTHVLRIESAQQYFNLNSVRLTAVAEPDTQPPPEPEPEPTTEPDTQPPPEPEPAPEPDPEPDPEPQPTPFGGTPISIPGTFEAENFDLGGQDAAYLDHVPGNAGQQYRLGEDVDIIITSDTAGGLYDVNNFETGEWLAYTVNVAEAGDYALELRAATAFDGAAFHVEVDGQDRSGRVDMPNTGAWINYEWIYAGTIGLTPGTHVLKIVSDQQYFNLNSVRVDTPGDVLPPPVDPGALAFFCSFPNSPNDCNFYEQAKEPGRATIVNVAREGNTGVRLHTEPGDANVSGSGSAVRNDLSLSQADTGCYEGQEHWWAHSVLFPSDYVSPANGWGVAFDFHQTGSGGGSTGQANFHVDTSRFDGLLHLRGYGGPPGTPYNSDKYEVTLGPIVKNTWYDFVYHVKWSSANDGFMIAWLNGTKVLEHYGPTLYTGQGCYLKLANYHSDVGAPSSVVHDRVLRGSTPQAVSARPLEGVLEFVNGVLIPVDPQGVSTSETDPKLQTGNVGAVADPPQTEVP